MNSNKFNEVIDAQINRCTDILCTKAEEYAADDDRLHNFKCAAGMMNCDPKEALAGMMAKHTISVYDMCRSGKEYPIELWNEKITDHINYLLLLRGLVEEEFLADENSEYNKIKNSICSSCVSQKWCIDNQNNPLVCDCRTYQKRYYCYANNLKLKWCDHCYFSALNGENLDGVRPCSRCTYEIYNIRPNFFQPLETDADDLHDSDISQPFHPLEGFD